MLPMALERTITTVQCDWARSCLRRDRVDREVILLQNTVRDFRYRRRTQLTYLGGPEGNDWQSRARAGGRGV